MKAPRFEALARKYDQVADVYYLFSEEAHPRAASSARLNAFADQLLKMDANGDGRVERSEFVGPAFMFDAFDLDHDGVVMPHELYAARRIDDFKDFDAPKSYAERVQVIERFRREVPGRVRVLVDEMDNRTARAFGGLPNMAFVVDRAGVVREKQDWANAGAADAQLARLTGLTEKAATLTTIPQIDWTVVATERARAQKSGRPLLVELTAPGCPACRAMQQGTLADERVRKALGAVELATLSVDEDRRWALFEALGLQSTPGFALVDAQSGRVKATIEGAQPPEAFLRFLRQ